VIESGRRTFCVLRVVYLGIDDLVDVLHVSNDANLSVFRSQPTGIYTDDPAYRKLVVARRPKFTSARRQPQLKFSHGHCLLLPIIRTLNIILENPPKIICIVRIVQLNEQPCLLLIDNGNVGPVLK
jgi:hypothetical protein